MEKTKIQPGSKAAPDEYRIEVIKDGPYCVYGSPPLSQQIIMTNRKGESVFFQEGLKYSTDNKPTAICRCGYSTDKPYCDGSHVEGYWDSRPARPEEALLDKTQKYTGPRLDLTDNEKYCAFARFCDPKGRVWNLVGIDSEEAAELTIYEANHCPAGRLSAWEKGSKEPIEPDLEPSLGLIQDPAIRCSGPLWVRGGIKIVNQEDGYKYEVRNRVTLCRCGAASNKPFCDGTHASMKFRDGLPMEPEPDGERW